MPGFDRTGPSGSGAMTGRQMGVCKSAESDNPPRGTGGWGRGWRRGFGRGSGAGRGFGFHRRNRFWNEPVSGESNQTHLENEVRYLKDQLNQTEKKLEKLRNEKS